LLKRAAVSGRTAGELILLRYSTGFWWFTMWLLLAGRVSWGRMFPPAIGTGLFWLGMEAAFSIFMSRMVISDDREYGPIGTVFSLMVFLVAIGVVVILGAVVGLVWQELDLSFTAPFRKLQRPP
jgi:membrane protein